jgi:hypothetical protein
MITWLLFILVVALFIAINIIVGCYTMIRLGFGPPDWKTALNLVFRVTTIQDQLNAGRNWLAQKAPKIDTLLTRLCVPQPIIIVQMPKRETNDETGENNGNSVIEQSEEFVDASADVIQMEPEPHAARYQVDIS